MAARGGERPGMLLAPLLLASRCRESSKQNQQQQGVWGAGRDARPGKGSPAAGRSCAAPLHAARAALTGGRGGRVDGDEPQQLELLELDLDLRGGMRRVRMAEGRMDEHGKASGRRLEPSAAVHATAPAPSHAAQPSPAALQPRSRTLLALLPSGMSSADTSLKSGGPSLLRARRLGASAGEAPWGGERAWDAAHALPIHAAGCWLPSLPVSPASHPHSPARTDDLVDGARRAQQRGPALAQD